eukprot:scaffold17553_cov112-Isochrysis_galbana.AAC.2
MPPRHRIGAARSEFLARAQHRRVGSPWRRPALALARLEQTEVAVTARHAVAPCAVGLSACIGQWLRRIVAIPQRTAAFKTRFHHSSWLVRDSEQQENSRWRCCATGTPRHWRKCISMY